MDEKDLAGKWQIVEAPDMAEGYLDLTPDPHIQITVRSKKEAEGQYQFGAQDGFIDGHFETDKCGHYRLVFSFEGSDEMDRANGRGTAILESPNKLLLMMHYHMGDTYSFKCIRES